MAGFWAAVGREIGGASTAAWGARITQRGRGALVAGFGLLTAAALASHNVADPSWNAAAAGAPANWLGAFGANLSDAALQSLGFAAWAAVLLLLACGLSRLGDPEPDERRAALRRRAVAGALGVLLLAGVLAAVPTPDGWAPAQGFGGFWGDAAHGGLSRLVTLTGLPHGGPVAALLLSLPAVPALLYALGLHARDLVPNFRRAPAVEIPEEAPPAPKPAKARVSRRKPAHELEIGPRQLEEAPAHGGDEDENEAPPFALDDSDEDEGDGRVHLPAPSAGPRVSGVKAPRPPVERRTPAIDADPGFDLPDLDMLAKPKPRSTDFDESALKANAQLLEQVLAEFGVRGTIDQIRPGPVVTLYELVPAAGVKSARVVALADDIARNMSARACRVSVVQGRNAIGIELPNKDRETVYLRDLLSSEEFEKGSPALPMALGENIGGDPYVADLAKMPHLLIAGTTGSGKSVGVNAMILSILFRHGPDKCRFIMIDPKMLELSIYDGIPHLLAPVVTDPKKAIVALKWTVREMEDRYRRMSKIGVRNVAGYNERAAEAIAKDECFVRTVQVGFDESGKPVYEEETIKPELMPYLVVVIDEVADLMMVAGKDIEGAVQRLAQMARAAGIHLIMATQRPSVDVITGTIKANFPTRISFQVTSKIDARTIMSEQGAEQLLGQGDMLYMAGGGRITRLHGPFVSDQEVETVVTHLKAQGYPQYLEEVTAGGDDDEDGDPGTAMSEGTGDLYDQAVAVVTRDRKASTSYVQRRLQIGYNRAASLIERMEQEGVVGAANHAGKREVLAPPPP
ncbi:MAG: DNA translocase FtsK 4TM domain-containing protein [Proteobacteria bacterium]|nr:DNA translocase FtsK 4TM domain-containing protein [Pseudomonadota bacterium]